MEESGNDIHKEIKIRGQVLALSLKLEDSITKIIYSFFIPKNNNQEILELYLKEFIMPIAFGKKVSLFKQLLKTESYAIKLKEYLDSEPSIIRNKNIADVKDLIDYLNHNLSEILKTRNLIAHGVNINNLVSNEIDLNEDSFVFANKLKPEILDEQFLKKFSEKTILTAFIILKIN